MNVKVRSWAHNNAFTLIFLSVMFFITWAVTTVVAYVL